MAVYGPEGARLLYGRPEIRRRDAIPRRVQRTLFGEGGVQSLDGEDHRHRKRMFMQIMTEERLKELGQTVSLRLRRHAEQWSGRPRLALMRAAEDVLMEAGAAWTGVPLPGSHVARRARQMSMMLDGFAAIGPRHWAGRLMRRRSEAWMASLVERTRAGEMPPPSDSALAVVAFHRDLRGELLSPQVAAVELLNLIRPPVAVARLPPSPAWPSTGTEGARRAMRN